MDLIYTDTTRRDVGVLHSYTLDLAFGADENDFELTIDLDNHCCEADYLVYIEGTEYGGIIDGLFVSTSENKLIYKGRTWHGILASKVIEPNSGEDYLIMSGDANEIIGQLLKRSGLDDLFVTPTEPSGIYVDNYKFGRYVDVYTGIVKMLVAVSGKLKLMFVDGVVVISALPSVDYSQNEQFDNDDVEMEIEKLHNSVNHIICIGKKGKDDEDNNTNLPVVHLYKDNNGMFKQDVQTKFTGIHEIIGIYEYSSADDLDKLMEGLANGDTESLKKIITEDKVQINLSADDNTYDVGDIIGAQEIITGTSVTQRITKKIVTISQGEVNIQYKVGE